MNLRVPPHSTDAEQAVLGGLMISPNALADVTAILSEDDFYRKDHRLIFRAICELDIRNSPFDAVTLGEWFDAHFPGELFNDSRGSSYVLQLAGTTASAANILAHANIVHEKYLRRRTIDKATGLIDAAFGADHTSEELIDCAVSDFMEMQRTQTQHEFTLQQAMTMAYTAARNASKRGGKVPGIASGLDRLDRVLGGWHPGDLNVLGARPSMGKTALLLNFALSANEPCGIISAEQPAQQMGARVMSIKSHVPAVRMRNGDFQEEDLVRLQGAIEELKDRHCVFYDRSAPTIAEVARMARKWKRQRGIRFLLVDYLQRIKPSETDRKANRSEKVGEVARGLKEIARDLEIPVFSLAQVGRDVEKRADKQPTMADMSDSGEIEKEADQILTLYRPHVYDDNANEHDAVISVEKNRHGPTGIVKCFWLPETMRFENMVSEEAAAR